MACPMQTRTPSPAATLPPGAPLRATRSPVATLHLPATRSKVGRRGRTEWNLREGHRMRVGGQEIAEGGNGSSRGWSDACRDAPCLNSTLPRRIIWLAHTPMLCAPLRHHTLLTLLSQIHIMAAGSSRCTAPRSRCTSSSSSSLRKAEWVPGPAFARDGESTREMGERVYV